MLSFFQEDVDEEAFADFPNYNRDFEMYEVLLKEKERVWEEELLRLMAKSGRNNSIVGNAISKTTKMMRRQSQAFAQAINEQNQE